MADWYYASKDNQQIGPVAGEQLAALFHAGEISRETLVWREGLENWLPLRRSCDELGLQEASAAAAAAVDVPAPPPAPEASPQPPAVPPAAAKPRVSSPAHVPVTSVPPPRTGMSGCAIAAIVTAVVLVLVIGALAAIAVPAYRAFERRAGVSVAMTTAMTHQQAVAEFQQQHDTCPDNTSQGFQSPESYADEHVASIKFGQFEDGNCVMEVKMRGGDLEGKLLWLEHAGDDWRCSSEIKDELLPANCRSH